MDGMMNSFPILSIKSSQNTTRIDSTVGGWADEGICFVLGLVVVVVIVIVFVFDFVVVIAVRIIIVIAARAAGRGAIAIAATAALRGSILFAPRFPLGAAATAALCRCHGQSADLPVVLRENKMFKIVGRWSEHEK